jgi:hypothetical protein
LGSVSWAWRRGAALLRLRYCCTAVRPSHVLLRHRLCSAIAMANALRRSFRLRGVRGQVGVACGVALSLGRSADSWGGLFGSSRVIAARPDPTDPRPSRRLQLSRHLSNPERFRCGVRRRRLISALFGDARWVTRGAGRWRTHVSSWRWTSAGGDRARRLLGHRQGPQRAGG